MYTKDIKIERHFYCRWRDVLREKNKMLCIDLELVSREDKEKVIKYLNETKLLKTTYDPVEDLFKL